jgi:hypothetical protein
VVPTASSSNLFNGLSYPHHWVIPGLLASGVPIVLQLATIFMLRGDRKRSWLPVYNNYPICLPRRAFGLLGLLPNCPSSARNLGQNRETGSHVSVNSGLRKKSCC